MEEHAWWKGGPVASSAVLTAEMLKRAFDVVMRETMGQESVMPLFYTSKELKHKYMCYLARLYWKREYREFRMFRTACERGWLNGC